MAKRPTTKRKPRAPKKIDVPSPRLSTAAMIVAGLLSMAGSPAAEAAMICGYDVTGAYTCRDVHEPESWSRSQTWGPITTIQRHAPNGAIETETCVMTAGGQLLCN